MMFMLGVVLTALAILFLLTTMALWASEELRHPMRVTAALVALLAMGLALLLE
jgi:hypothetical protein